MIHYHGLPITPSQAAIEVLSQRHGFVSYAHPDQLDLALEVCQSVAVDCGAYTIWKQGGTLDVKGYSAWVEPIRRHPGFDFAVIPDVIDGSELDNDRMMATWSQLTSDFLHDVPVWHLHESLERLVRLARAFRRVALGSSGDYSDPGSMEWCARMDDAMEAICEDGQPICGLHGLRMLDPEIFTKYPFASADSTNVARNIGYDVRWSGPYQPLTKKVRALVLASRIEHYNSAPVWTRRTFAQGQLVMA